MGFSLQCGAFFLLFSLKAVFACLDGKRPAFLSLKFLFSTSVFPEFTLKYNDKCLTLKRIKSQQFSLEANKN